MVRPRTRIARNCLECGTPFEVNLSEIKKGGGFLCSKSCSNTWQSHTRRVGEGSRVRTYAKKKAEPYKEAARRKARAAIKAGTLIKLPCKICADIRVQAHHDDYSKPLDVEWLCRKHHYERDEQLGANNFGRALQCF